LRSYDHKQDKCVQWKKKCFVQYTPSIKYGVEILKSLFVFEKQRQESIHA